MESVFAATLTLIFPVDSNWVGAFAVAFAAVGFAGGFRVEERAELTAFFDRSDFIQATAMESERWPFSSEKIEMHFPQAQRQTR